MTHPSPIHIAFNIDHNYVQYCAVTLLSAVRNRGVAPLSFHVIANDLTDTDRNKLLSLVQDEQQCSLHFYTPGNDMLDGFQILKFKKRISLATYYRCFLSEILPDEVERVIYLDCDILVLQPLDDFFNLPLNGRPIAAVEDIASDDTARYSVLAYPEADSYFNAGVFLADLARWRKEDVPGRCLSYYRKYPERIVFNDQDLLNSIFHGDKLLVPLKWNVQDAFYRPLKKLQHKPDEMKQTLIHPAVLHFTNKKPWNYDNFHPLRQLYFEYESQLPWKPHRNAARFALLRFAKKLPFLLHLRREKYINLHTM